MAHDEVKASAYNDFGNGHFRDPASRLYKVISRRRGGSGIVWKDLVEGDLLVIDVRIPRMSMQKKVERIKAGTLSGAAVIFPRVGDDLRLAPVPSLRGAPSEVVATVQRGYQREQRSAVARLLVTVVSVE